MLDMQEKIKKYKVSSEDLRTAEVIILDGVIYKDRHHCTEKYGGLVSLMSKGDIDKRTMNIYVGCETQDGCLRYYKNY